MNCRDGYLDGKFVFPAYDELLSAFSRVLLILCVLVSAFNAAGTMPIFKKSGGIEIVICSGHGPVRVVSSTTETSYPKNKKSHTPPASAVCSWSLLHHAVIDANVPLFDAPVFLWMRLPDFLVAISQTISQSIFGPVGRSPPFRVMSA